MKHAIIMTMHKNYKINQMLIDLFDDERFDFYILVDKKVADSDQTIIPNPPKKSKLIFLPRIKISWAGYSQIKAFVSLLETSTEMDYDYYHFLQGSDFPIKTRDEIDEYFTENKGKEFINIHYSDYGKFKCQYYHFFIENKRYRQSRILKGLNKLFVKTQKLFGIKRNKDLSVFCGSALTSLTHDCAKYIVERKDEIKKRFKHTLAADEVFLQSLLSASPYRKNFFESDNACIANCRLIDWKRHDGNSPYTFTEKDFGELINANKGLCFARKFDENTDFKVVEKLYDYLKEKQSNNN